MRVACWISKAINTHSEYVIFVVFPLQQWMNERVSVLSYTYIACLVNIHFVCKFSNVRRLRLKCDGTPDLVFLRNGRVNLNRLGASVQSTKGSRGVRISGSNAGYTMFRGSVKSTGYPLHSPVSPSLTPLVRHRVPSRLNWTLPTLNLSK